MSSCDKWWEDGKKNAMKSGKLLEREGVAPAEWQTVLLVLFTPPGRSIYLAGNPAYRL